MFSVFIWVAIDCQCHAMSNLECMEASSRLSAYDKLSDSFRIGYILAHREILCYLLTYLLAERAGARWLNVWNRNFGTITQWGHHEKLTRDSVDRQLNWLTYSSAAPTMQIRTIRTILKSIFFLIGSQWSSSRIAADMLNFEMIIQDLPSGRVRHRLKPIEEKWVYTIFWTVIDSTRST